MNISSSTREQYSKIATRLQRAYAQDENRDWSVDPLRFVFWFAEKARMGFWSRRTFWMYRTASVWFMEQSGPAVAVEALRAISVRLRKNGSETSSKKLKKLPEETWRNLTGNLSNSANPLDKVILHWLYAGRCSGLRPCEWEHAAMDSSNLTVLNAKRNEVRANGEQRKIIFDPVNNRTELAAIQLFLRDVRTWTGTGRSFRDMYDRCRKRLFYVCRVLKAGLDEDNDQGISLYSPRHQFAADMKASGLTKAQVAALMGHASEDSATIHYARRRDGLKRIPPSSPAGQVASVRRGAGVTPDPATAKDDRKE